MAKSRETEVDPAVTTNELRKALKEAADIGNSGEREARENELVQAHLALFIPPEMEARLSHHRGKRRIIVSAMIGSGSSRRSGK